MAARLHTHAPERSPVSGQRRSRRPKPEAGVAPTASRSMMMSTGIESEIGQSLPNGRYAHERRLQN